MACFDTFQQIDILEAPVLSHVYTSLGKTQLQVSFGWQINLLISNNST